MLMTVNVINKRISLIFLSRLFKCSDFKAFKNLDNVSDLLQIL
jgi:hypothetical protein